MAYTLTEIAPLQDLKRYIGQPQMAGMALLFPRVAALTSLGFVMGSPFALAVRLAESRELATNVPILWGASGIASVLGSALAMIVGISIVFW